MLTGKTILSNNLNKFYTYTHSNHPMNSADAGQKEDFMRRAPDFDDEDVDDDDIGDIEEGEKKDMKGHYQT